MVAFHGILLTHGRSSLGGSLCVQIASLQKGIWEASRIQKGANVAGRHSRVVESVGVDRDEGRRPKGPRAGVFEGDCAPKGASGSDAQGANICPPLTACSGAQVGATSSWVGTSS